MSGRVTPTAAFSGVLVLAALLIVVLVVHSLLSPGTPVAPRLPTATVLRGTVTNLATEAGTLVPVDQQNVNFRQPGQLTEVDVKVGDHVTAGQVLAKIDNRTLADALSQAQQRQQQDQATLNATLTGNAVQTAQHNVDAARTELANATAQAALTNQQDAVTVAQDQTFLSRDAGVLARDQAQLTRDAGRLAADQAALNADENQLQKDSDVVAQDQAQVAKDQGKVSVDQTKLSQDQAKAQADGCLVPSPPPTCSGDLAKVHDDQSQLASDQKTLASDQKTLAQDQGPVTADQAQVQADSTRLGTDSSLVVTDRQLVSTDSTRVEQDQTALRADLQKQAADQVAGKRAVDQAQAALTSAEDALTAQTSLRPNTIAGEQAVVAADAAAVNTAQQNLGEAVLTAPVDGVVGTINGIVGEQVLVGGGVLTPVAPGSDAPQPNTTSSTSQAFLGGSSPATGGGNIGQAFITLTDVHSFQVVALVAEADAARVRSAQDAMVSFDALPGVKLSAQVVAVGPDATLVQNVTNYLVTLNLESVDPRLRSGMTARTAIAVGEARSVLEVPNSAIHRSGGQTYVTEITPGGTQLRVTIQTGLVGDTTTEVVSGLHEGDRVLLPPVTPPAGIPGEPLS